jgi:hypothetical protein
MPTLAERTSAFCDEHGEDATFTRAGGGTPATYDPVTNEWPDGDSAGEAWTRTVFEDDPQDDDFEGGTLIVRNPVVLLVPNSAAVTFPPAQGHRIDYMGTRYSVTRSRPYVFDGAVQFWRVIGGV